jgi:hypothetical protein
LPPRPLGFKTKKPRAGCLACPRLTVPMVYFVLRHPPVNFRADLSVVPIIIVVIVTKYPHLYMPLGVHMLFRARTMQMPCSEVNVKQKIRGNGLACTVWVTDQDLSQESGSGCGGQDGTTSQKPASHNSGMRPPKGGKPSHKPAFGGTIASWALF